MKRFMLILLSATVYMQSMDQFSRLVYPGENGKLIYRPYTDQGDIIPDFSNCGYMGGGVPIPDVPVKIVLEPNDFSSDDGTRIQQAIDQLSRRRPDRNGHRGTILLKKGWYNLQNTLNIRASGIVLRGEGNGDDGTVIVATAKKQYTIISVGDYHKPVKISRTEQRISDDYVPSGCNSFNVVDASGFKPGDAVIVERPSTQPWIDSIGMSSIPALWHSAKNLNTKTREKYRAEGRLSDDGSKYNSTVQWEPGSKDLLFERTITEVEGNRIILNAPVTNAIQKEFGGGTVYKYTVENRISQVGIENLLLLSEYDPDVKKVNKMGQEYCADERHAKNGLSFSNCRDSWARNVIVKHVGFTSFNIGIGSLYVTIQDCKALDAVSTIRGGTRYSFNFKGQLSLYQRCYANEGRHDFVLGATVPGPNAFVDCRSENSHSPSEPHHRWSVGCLYDNCFVWGYDGYISFSNRGNFGTGHGWSGAQMVAWNCKAGFILAMRPPTAQNFVIGNYGVYKDKYHTRELIQSRVDIMNKKSGKNFKYYGQPVVGDAYIESPDAYVKPQFLYYQQLWDRLGKQAVVNVTTPAQREVIFGEK